MWVWVTSPLPSGRITGVRKNNPVVSVAALRQLLVATPSIGQNPGGFFGNVINERHKAGAGHIRYQSALLQVEARGVETEIEGASTFPSCFFRLSSLNAL
jgi:hypothetical protein